MKLEQLRRDEIGNALLHQRFRFSAITFEIFEIITTDTLRSIAHLGYTRTRHIEHRISNHTFAMASKTNEQVVTETFSERSAFADAAMGGIFSYTDSTVANFRQKDDAVNGAIGGCAAGFVLGAAARSVPMMFGGCASLAALIGTFDAAGKSLQGTYARASATDFSHGHDASPGTPGWREAREARRQSFFKQKKEDVESDA
ncbi:mitochondrial import inner membrane translocase subunit [Pseudozyma hubeiensis SY62]|uniref:Mitochondrial import inner membrane translocase subunit n=1 Tax=Pseudozyma hubeiensis (strain SY62) TaxID=1305764 RepID=R9P888_PSEHS|nr:mitochondrial import inner membrane translocase subunit [Pseudozyma hubeiensis SY62]GAC97462.1 mitochondrial import inner membrane translocase subunit [Pseudozyma hubeiensis SY62]